MMPATISLASDTIGGIFFDCSAVRKVEDHGKKSEGNNGKRSTLGAVPGVEYVYSFIAGKGTFDRFASDACPCRHGESVQRFARYSGGSPFCGAADDGTLNV
jgi:hypothetical protein